MAMAKSLKHDIHKACLYDVGWQKMRVEMLGTWSDQARASANMRKLIDYINGSAEDSMEEYFRTHRIVNYMAAIRMGFNGTKRKDGVSLINSEADKIVVNIANIARKIKEGNQYARKQGELDWDWHAVVDDLIECWGSHHSSFLNIYANLDKRVNFATHVKKVNPKVTRRELLYFLELMWKVMHGENEVEVAK